MNDSSGCIAALKEMQKKRAAVSPMNERIARLRERSENMPYRVDDQTAELYKTKVIPAWKGNALRDMIFDNLSGEWLDAYQAGIWTEFMEQRAPGHTAGGERIFASRLSDEDLLEFFEYTQVPIEIESVGLAVFKENVAKAIEKTLEV